ncbi:MAG: hypothetical protein IJ157_13475 [Clostridia bacterium]|nr:hypothetical protein [Clostridia bacterium]
MKNRMLTRIAALIVGLLLIGVVIFGFAFAKRQLARPAQTAADTPADTSEAADGSVKGPFCLRLTYPKIGNETYVSFNVYYRHEGGEELWYTCGRMFPNAETASIDWVDDQYNIAVTLKSGRQEFFAYDGNNNWQ